MGERVSGVPAQASGLLVGVSVASAPAAGRSSVRRSAAAKGALGGLEKRPPGCSSRTPATAAALVVCALLGPACTATPDSAPGVGTTAGPSRPAAHAKDPGQCRRTLVGVAHPDDDLFFLNPEIRQTIRAGCPVDTVYLTAGDDGKKNRDEALEYVDRREYGVRAAYAEMAEAANRWERADVRADGVRVRSYRLADKARDTDVRLTFLDLHDGLPRGQEPNSLLRLFDGSRRASSRFRAPRATRRTGCSR
ncbi:PIG-L family deacetylase [Streptomyces sp. INA 01156]